MFWRNPKPQAPRPPRAATICVTDRFVLVYAEAYGGLWLTDFASYHFVADVSPFPDVTAVGAHLCAALSASRVVEDQAEVQRVINGSDFGGWNDAQAAIAVAYRYKSFALAQRKMKQLWIRQDECGITAQPTKRAYGPGWTGLNTLVPIAAGAPAAELGEYAVSALERCM